MVIQITDDLGASRAVRLNQEMGGEKVNDVRLGLFDVHVEEVRDVTSSRELEMQQLQMLIQSGVPVPPKVLIESTTLKNKEEILAGMV